MKKITVDQLPGKLARLPDQPRVVVSGNFATPTSLLHAVDHSLPLSTLHVRNAPGQPPTRPGVVHGADFGSTPMH